MRNRLTTTATISTTNQEMFMASLDFNIENWHLVTDDQEMQVTDINPVSYTHLRAHET